MRLKRHTYYLFCSISAAILLTLCWEPFGFFVTGFVGFVPLFFLEQKVREQKDSSTLFFVYVSLTLFLWNAAVTFWIWNATAFGAIAAFIINMLMMSLPFVVYHRMQKRTHDNRAEWIFIFSWIAFEFWHLNWDLSWPWLTLGNIFSTAPSIVQWYEYTGYLGGTFWVLFVNFKIFNYLKNFNERSVVMNFSKAFNLLFFLLFAPIFLSYYISIKYTETEHPVNVLVVQPNIDPYKDKFGNMTPFEQTTKMLKIAEEKMDSSVQLVCFPETSLMGNLDEKRLETNESIQLVRQFMHKFPNATIVSGADTYKFYDDPKQKSTTARKLEGDEFYDVYNTALYVDSSQNIQIYHKAKLVPGVEKMPFPKVFHYLDKFAVSLGGTSGSLGNEDSSKVFNTYYGHKIAPVICYESIYGEFVGTYISKGAELICIVTNDGWWGKTPGIYQHFNFAALRAIETRRYVARSANTGVSGFFDAKGNIISKTEWWKDDAQKATLNYNSGETFYVKYGDYIGRFSCVVALISIVFYWRKSELADY
ncbi:MAG: apolipoprotein N-acyltransferase [Bacteroidota bacterium]